MYKREIDELNWLRVENARLNADMDRTAADVVAVIDGQDPDTWAWPLHGLRDVLVAANDIAKARERERDAIPFALPSNPSTPVYCATGAPNGIAPIVLSNAPMCATQLFTSDASQPIDIDPK